MSEPKRAVWHLLLPLEPDIERVATLSAMFPLTEGQWDRLMALLAAMKPGLVRAEAPNDAEHGRVEDAYAEHTTWSAADEAKGGGR